MSHNDLNNKMNMEIEKRLNSSEWDKVIASKVISRRNKHIRRNVFSISSLSLLATAAVIVVAVFINAPSVKINDLDVFIAAQVDGIHKEVFNESYSDNLLMTDTNEDIGGPIYNLVDSALSMR